MAANPLQLSGLATATGGGQAAGRRRRPGSASQEAAKTRVPFVTHLVQNKLVSARGHRQLCLGGVRHATAGHLRAGIWTRLPKNLVDEKLIRANHAIPVFHRGNRLFVAVSDPTNRKGLDEIKFQTGISTEEVLVDENQLSAFIDAFLESQERRWAG